MEILKKIKTKMQNKNNNKNNAQKVQVFKINQKLGN